MIERNMSYHSCIKSQQGFTLIGWMVVIAIFLFFAYLAMIITPSLISNNTINSILESLKEEPGITQSSKRDIRRLIDNRLMINQVTNLTTEDFEIVKEPDKVMINMEYDDTIHFAGNVYIIIEREKSIELIRN